MEHHQQEYQHPRSGRNSPSPSSGQRSMRSSKPIYDQDYDELEKKVRRMRNVVITLVVLLLLTVLVATLLYVFKSCGAVCGTQDYDNIRRIFERSQPYRSGSTFGGAPSYGSGGGFNKF